MKTILKKYWFNFLIISIMLLGVFLRLKGLLINPSMWHDECGLAFNILNKNYHDFFGVLRFHQTAPPFFMIAAKFMVNLFNVSNSIGTCDLILRLIPFSCSVLSIWVFYLICKDIFKAKLSIAFATFLFATNNELINYSYEFKPYAVDVFLILLLILFFIKLDLERISYKKLTLSAIGLSLAVWFSFVSVFAIGAGFINQIIKRKNFKKLFFLCLPITISGLLYLRFYLLNTYLGHSTVMIDFWKDEFVLSNFSNFLPLLVENLRYFFFPATSILFVLMLVIYGIVVLYKEKEYDATNIILLTFLLLVISSAFHIYPFSKRLILFLIPLFLLLMVKPLDKISFSKKTKSLTKSFIISITFLCILIPQLLFAIDKINFKSINKGEFPKEMMAFMVQNIKPTDTIFINNASNWEFLYYSSFYNIKNKLINEKLSNTPDDKYLALLNSLEKGNYWFFLPYDYSHLEIINFVKNWAKQNTKIIYINEATQSTLIYLEIK